MTGGAPALFESLLLTADFRKPLARARARGAG
jgi:hypothetical protein